MFKPRPLNEIKLKYNKLESEAISEDSDLKLEFLKSISACEIVLVRDLRNPKNYVYLSQKDNDVEFENIYRSKNRLIIRNEEYQIFLIMKTEDINKMFATFNPINTSQMMFVIDTYEFKVKEINERTI